MDIGVWNIFQISQLEVSPVYFEFGAENLLVKS